MKVSDLDPQFLRYTPRSYEFADDLASADGIMFQCPACAAASPYGPNSGQPDGKGYRGVHSILCWFVGRVPGDAQPGPGRWTPTGTGYHDLSFVNSPGLTCSVQLLGSCNAHFCIANGEIVGLSGGPPPVPMFSWDTLHRAPDGQLVLLYRHARLLAEPFMASARDCLDVGGWGVLAQRLIEDGKRCTILDLFTPDQHYADRVRALPYVEGDVRDAACFAAGSFDVVSCFEVLEHCGGIDLALASMFHWLRPGGWLAGTIPIPGATHAADEPGIEFLTDEALGFQLARAGFGDIFIEPTVSIGLPDEKPSSLYFRGRRP